MTTEMNQVNVQENERTEDDTREQELLSKIAMMEQQDNLNAKMHKIALHKMKLELKERTEEREQYKTKLQKLETELMDAKKQNSNILSPAQATQVEKVKQMSEEVLTKAKGVIFDKTKICKNQELQIEALNAQVMSLKEVLSITKDLLEIRNMEVHHLEDKLNCMEAKIVAEKERRSLMDQKMEALTRMNRDLKDEYQIQLRIFNALKSQYNEREDLQKSNDINDDNK